MCCSIIGYCGKNVGMGGGGGGNSRGGGGAAPIIVQGLKRMEYRGYDSVGVATSGVTGNGEGGASPTDIRTIQVRKSTGKVSDVNAAVKLDMMPGDVGIGHTRWSTHGSVTDANAHPHPSSSGKIAIVHNGIIENFVEIRNQLELEGYEFRSETDSEVIANLLQKNYWETGSVRESMVRTVKRLRGEYAFVAMFENGRLAAARMRAPLILGIGRDDLFLSSDVLGFIEYTDEATYMENGSMVIVNEDRTTFEMLDFAGRPARYEITKVSKEFGGAYKGDYAHFTLKEIYEQHETVIAAGRADGESEIMAAAAAIKTAGGVYLTGSGSSYNAALVAKNLFVRQARISAEPIMASEIQFASEGIDPGSVLVAISQSGESADVLNAVRIARSRGCTIVSVVNVMASSLAHESDLVVGMNCGPEIGVAATKSFTSQLVVFDRITSEIARQQREQDAMEVGSGGDGGKGDSIAGISLDILRILEDPVGVQKVAGELKEVSDIYILGRGIHYPIAVEAALKIKELTYIHAEGIAGGELKHGPLALMDSDVYVIIINPHDATYEETLTSATEIQARGAKIIGISDVESDVYDHWIKIPNGSGKAGGSAARGLLSYAIPEIILIQILAYYVALERETDPDYPRNLAKSVTVR